MSQQLGIPNFPQDFPDCPAAADLAQLSAAEQVSPALLLLSVMLLNYLSVSLHLLPLKAAVSFLWIAIVCAFMTGNCSMSCYDSLHLV